MPLVSDSFHEKKLKDFKINIKTKYAVGNKIYERNTDGSINDDITSGVRCEKEYYIGPNLVHKETDFDSRIEYTFISKEMENREYKCPNCGMQSQLKNFKNGCPYCRTNYNIEYTDKDLGSKYHYDRVLRNTTYRVVTAIVDVIISVIICFFFIQATSRTFNSIDIAKVFIYGAILSLVLYYLFYIVDAYIILGPIKIYKDRQNQKQIDFWNRTKLDKKSFFNNVNYEVRKYYYSKNNVIDFDVLDYIAFKEFNRSGTQHVSVTAEVRIVYYENGRIKAKFTKEEYVFRKNPTDKLEIHEGVNMIKCHNCGHSIDATKGICEYCRTEIKYLQEWIIVNK